MSFAHVVFYVPLAALRLAYVVVPPALWSALGPEARLQLLALGLELYALVAPVHVANFSLCMLRVPGFSSRLAYLLRLKSAGGGPVYPRASVSSPSIQLSRCKSQ